MLTFMLTLLRVLGRAAFAHGCGEAFRWLLEYYGSGISPIICGVIGLVIGVGLVEVILVLWHRYRASR